MGCPIEWMTTPVESTVSVVDWERLDLVHTSRDGLYVPIACTQSVALVEGGSGACPLSLIGRPGLRPNEPSSERSVGLSIACV